MRAFRVEWLSCEPSLSSSSRWPSRRNGDRFGLGASAGTEVKRILLWFGRVCRGVVLSFESQVSRDRRNVASILGRAFVGFFVELPVASLEVTLPHEISGHAGRIREFDGVPDVHLDLPPPYTFEGAKGNHVGARYTRSISTDEATVVDLAGQRVQVLQQRHLALSAFRAGELTRGDAVLYVGNAALAMAQAIGAEDIANAARGRGLDAGVYRRPYLASLPLVFLDPVFLASLYLGAYRYLVRGDRTGVFPSFRLPGGRFAVTSRVSPVPWGVEHNLDLLFGTRSLTVDLTVRTGLGSGSYGIDLSLLDYPITRVLRGGMSVSVFTHPGFRFGSLPIVTFGTTPLERVVGSAGYLRFEFVGPGGFFGVRFGAKTMGLLDERPLAAGAEGLLIGGVSLDSPRTL